jgi:hypothetical protein
MTATEVGNDKRTGRTLVTTDGDISDRSGSSSFGPTRQNASRNWLDVELPTWRASWFVTISRTLNMGTMT